MAVPHIQRLIQKGRGSEKRPYGESPELQSSCHKFCVVMVVSNGLRSTLIWSTFENFPGEHACALYVQKKFARAAWQHNLPTLCVPPPPPPPSTISGSASALCGALSSYTTQMQVHNSSRAIFCPASWLPLFIISPLHGFNYHQLAQHIPCVHPPSGLSKR